jgi:hypothetical protein
MSITDKVLSNEDLSNKDLSNTVKAIGIYLAFPYLLGALGFLIALIIVGFIFCPWIPLAILGFGLFCGLGKLLDFCTGRR